MNAVMPSLVGLVFLVCFLAALLFLARLMVAPFSPKVLQLLRRHPVIHATWGAGSVLVVYFYWYAMVAHPMWWPPQWIERHAQRKEVKFRVKQIGGWEAVRLGCETFVSNNPDGIFWFPPMSNVTVYPDPQIEPNRHYVTNLDYGPLPPAVAALNPSRVQYRRDEGCVLMMVFGVRRIHGHDTPYLAYEIDTSTNSNGFEHGFGSPADYIFGYSSYSVRRVAKGIYELY